MKKADLPLWYGQVFVTFKCVYSRIWLLPILALLAASCHSPHEHEHSNGQEANVAVTDTTFASPLDSLEWVIHTGTDDQKIVAISMLHRYRISERERVIELTKDLEAKYENSDNMVLRGLIASSMGGVYFESGMIDSALYCFQQSVAFLEKGDDEEYLANCRIRLGHTLFLSVQYDSAIETLLQALDYFEKNDKPNKIFSIYTLIALVYESMGNADKQEEYLIHALDLSKKADISKDQIGELLINYAIFHARKENFDEALVLGTQAVEKFREAGKNFEHLLGFALQRLVFISFVANRTDSIEAYLDEALAIAERLQHQPLKVEVLLAQSRYHTDVTKDYQAAFDDAKRAESLMDTTNLESMEFLYYQLTLASIGIRNREEGLHYLSMNYEANRKKQGIELAEKTSEMEVRYETAKKEHAIEQQQLVIARQNMQRGLLIGGVGICMVILALLWYMLRLRNRRNSALTERNDALTERNVALTEHADVLSEMNATKDKFFNIISHDLKNPTLALHDNLKLLVSNVRLWDADTLTDFSAELLLSAEGQVELLNSLLNWARIQTGRITCTPVAFDLAARLRTDISLVRKLAEQKGVTLDCQMPDDAVITGDSNMLATVVRNLLTNAVKFTAQGGAVTLTISSASPISPESEAHPSPRATLALPREQSSPFPVSEAHPSPIYTVSVTDTGTGMSAEQVENLFRLDKPQTRRGTVGEEGSGLGLIVCKELLGMHNSILQVSSEEGKGSRFWFSV